MPFTFTNPRTRAVFTDWPSGRFRTTCTFAVESHPKRGERVSRVTLDKNGRPCSPKHTTYAGKWAIVDGEDGRTYLLAHGLYGVTVKSSDMQLDAVLPDGSYFGDGHPRLPELLALIDARTTPP